MRFLYCVVCLLASQWVLGQSSHPWQFALSTGSTGYLGSTHGPGASGAFLTTATARWDLARVLRIESGVSVGAFGLTTVPHDRSIEQIQGGHLGLQWHPNWRPDLRINPFIGMGVGRYQQTVYSDLMDATGNPYFLWSDGQLYDMAENAPYARLEAETVTPDFDLESQVLNAQNWGIPVRFGLDWRIGDQLTVEAASWTFLGLEPGIDPIPNSSKDALTTFSIGLGWRPGAKTFQDPRIPETVLARNLDSDSDGIPDRKDQCYNTDAEATVDASGCPVDSDQDGIADHLDKEPHSIGMVTPDGISLTNAIELVPAPHPIHWDFKRVIAEPSTGTRPHLPVGQAFQRNMAKPIDNP